MLIDHQNPSTKGLMQAVEPKIQDLFFKSYFRSLLKEDCATSICFSMIEALVSVRKLLIYSCSL
jgi:hypothetical protein